MIPMKEPIGEANLCSGAVLIFRAAVIGSIVVESLFILRPEAEFKHAELGQFETLCA